MFAACQPNNLDGSRGWRDWKTHQLNNELQYNINTIRRQVYRDAEKTSEFSLEPAPRERRARENMMMNTRTMTGVRLPAGGGRWRCQRMGCFLGVRRGTAPPSVWGGGPAPSSGAGGRPSSLTCLTFHPEPPPAHRTHMLKTKTRQITFYITSSELKSPQIRPNYSDFKTLFSIISSYCKNRRAKYLDSKSS